MLHVGVLCHNGGRILLEHVSILRCRQHGAHALHTNTPPTIPAGDALAHAALDAQESGEEASATGGGSHMLTQNEADKPSSPKTPNFSRVTTPFRARAEAAQRSPAGSAKCADEPGRDQLDSQQVGGIGGIGDDDGGVDKVVAFEKRGASTEYFGPPAIVARHSSFAYNGIAGLAVCIL